MIEMFNNCDSSHHQERCCCDGVNRNFGPRLSSPKLAAFESSPPSRSSTSSPPDATAAAGEAATVASTPPTPSISKLLSTFFAPTLTRPAAEPAGLLLVLLAGAPATLAFRFPFPMPMPPPAVARLGGDGVPLWLLLLPLLLLAVIGAGPVAAGTPAPSGAIPRASLLLLLLLLWLLVWLLLPPPPPLFPPAVAATAPLCRPDDDRGLAVVFDPSGEPGGGPRDVFPDSALRMRAGGSSPPLSSSPAPPRWWFAWGGVGTRLRLTGTYVDGALAEREVRCELVVLAEWPSRPHARTTWARSGPSSCVGDVRRGDESGGGCCDDASPLGCWRVSDGSV